MKKRRLSKNQEDFLDLIVFYNLSVGQAYLESYKSAAKYSDQKLVQEGVKLLKELNEEYLEKLAMKNYQTRQKAADENYIKEYLVYAMESSKKSAETFGPTKDNIGFGLSAAQELNKMQGNYYTDKIKEKEINLRYGLDRGDNVDDVIILNDISELADIDVKPRIDIFSNEEGEDKDE